MGANACREASIVRRSVLADVHQDEMNRRYVPLGDLRREYFNRPNSLFLTLTQVSGYAEALLLTFGSRLLARAAGHHLIQVNL
jgi:hypothetical protein